MASGLAFMPWRVSSLPKRDKCPVGIDMCIQRKTKVQSYICETSGLPYVDISLLGLSELGAATFRKINQRVRHSLLNAEREHRTNFMCKAPDEVILGGLEFYM